MQLQFHDYIYVRMLFYVSVFLETICKVQLFWEGHKNLELFSTWFDIYLANVKSSGIFVAFS